LPAGRVGWRGGSFLCFFVVRDGREGIWGRGTAACRAACRAECSVPMAVAAVWIRVWPLRELSGTGALWWAA